MERMGQQQSNRATNTNTMQQQTQQPQTQQNVGTRETKPAGGGITSLAAHHAAAKLAAGLSTEVKGSSSTKNSPYTSRSNSFSSQGPFENQTQIKDSNQPANVAPTPAFPSRPVSSRGHMLPQSAQMISEKERQREAEMEHIFAPQPGQIIAERCELRAKENEQ
jgi:hypothetical protein